MNRSVEFLSVGIDVGADFSLMAFALPSQELLGKPYKIIHSSQRSLNGAVEKIKTLFLWNLQAFIITPCIIR